MSSDFYFHKWNQLIRELENTVNLDVAYQKTKAHDETCCRAAQRLGGLLAKYMYLYNDAVECLRQNLQIQKTSYVEAVVKAIAERILELKRQLRRLEGNRYQFLNNSSIQQILTSDDIDPKDIPEKVVRSDRVRAVIETIKLQANEKIDAVVGEANVIEEQETALNWWETGYEESNEMDQKSTKSELENNVSVEAMKRMAAIKLIQAHERSRQVIRKVTGNRIKRIMWEKELRGNLAPQARFEIKEKAATLIQKVMRVYFQIKRNKIKECTRNEILGLQLYNKVYSLETTQNEEIITLRQNRLKQMKNDWQYTHDIIKENYLKKERDNISEDYRDQLRYWFRKWFDEVKFFYNIPKEKHGGSSLIIKEEVLTPSEWQEKYEAYIIGKKTKKRETAFQIKYEQMEAKKEEMMLRKEAHRKKKQEAELLRKIMKNPNLHPGFNYPKSKKTEHIFKAIEEYRKYWHDLDTWNIPGVKEKFVKEVDENNAIMEAKMEILKIVDGDMRKELKILKLALKKDYEANGEKMPEMKKEKRKRVQRKRKLKSSVGENISGKLRDLAVVGILKDYPQTKFEDFLGDFNFAGDDLRCMLQPTLPLSGETRALWWERCLELIHGARRILLVGPKGCGKSTLVHALASVNDATLFELDPTSVHKDLLTPAYLQQIVDSVATCAKAVQPAVIYLRKIHQYYYTKTPPGDCQSTVEMFKRYFVQSLCKKIHKTDLITIIGCCRDPWLTKSRQLLRKFPEVVMLPYSSYSIVSLLLHQWKANNSSVPRDLELQSLSHTLQGHSYAFLKQALEDFMSPDRIIKIGAYGLKPQEILDYILDLGEEKIDYNAYQQWYTANTAWGRKEAARLKADKEFKLLCEEFAKKMAKKEKKL